MTGRLSRRFSVALNQDHNVVGEAYSLWLSSDLFSSELLDDQGQASLNGIGFVTHTSCPLPPERLMWNNDLCWTTSLVWESFPELLDFRHFLLCVLPAPVTTSQAVHIAREFHTEVMSVRVYPSFSEKQDPCTLLLCWPSTRTVPGTSHIFVKCVLLPQQNTLHMKLLPLLLTWIELLPGKKENLLK